MRRIHLVSIASPFRLGVEDMTRPPSGILYVGGYLKRRGYEVVIHHIRPNEADETAQRILADPSVLFVGFSLFTGTQVADSGAVSAKIKAESPEITVVWGGVHPSLMPVECLAFGFVDFVVIGEGEATAADLADHLSGTGAKAPEEIRGLAFVRAGRPFCTERRPFAAELDEFRQDWSMVDLQRYVRVGAISKERSFAFITSRGCPHSCGFCYNQAFNMRRWRSHSVEFVVRELLEVKKKTGISSVSFDDDNFFSNRDRAFKILDELANHGLLCRWLDLRVDYITEDLVARLVDLGVQSIFMGWESGSPRTLKKISKGFSPDTILEKTRILAKFKELSVDASAIVGFPWESNEDINATISLALEMFRVKPFRLNFNIGVYVPYPGTPLSSEAAPHGFSFPEDLESWRSFDILSGAMKLPWLSRKAIERITLIDRYAKLLFVHKGTNPLMKSANYVLALSSYLRLRTGAFFLPLEIRITDWYIRRRLAGKLESEAIASG